MLARPGHEPVSRERLRDMVAMLRHRGPDGWGYYRDERIGLGHARLSIIDLSGGAQPLCNEDGAVWVTFNGEIFNYRELRVELESRGHEFKTASDTEVIVHSYEEYGEEAWERFNGQFALALWDRRARRLWLVRDRVGIHPLYYCTTDAGLLFASEAKAIFASKCIEPRLDSAGLMQVFSRWSVTAPDSVFAGVRSVAPGTAIVFNDELNAGHQRYWHLDFTPGAEQADLSLEEATEALGAHLDRAASLRLRADVPVGAYLSGGLDSSVIASSVRSANSCRLQSYAVRFADPAFDETAEQRRMAGLLGTEHHEVLCGAEQIRDVLPELIWHCETPLLRTAPGPLFLLSELVRDNDMKVVLTGEGADEFLAGYNIFKEDKVRRFWARDPESRMRPALLSRLYPYVGDGQRQASVWQAFFSRGLTDLDDDFYSHRVRWQNTAWGARLLHPDLRGGFDQAASDRDLASSFPDGWTDWPPLARAQAIETVTFMSSYLLSCQGDRVAMAHGIEVRYPFLDPDVVDFCCRLPSRLKLCGFRDKLVLRKLASRNLPREIWQRPKQPYRAPMTSAIFGESAPEYVDQLLTPDELRRHGLVEPAAVERLAAKARAREGRMGGEREEMALVAVLTLQLLAKHYLSDFSSRAGGLRRELDRTEPDVCVEHPADGGDVESYGRQTIRPGQALAGG